MPPAEPPALSARDANPGPRAEALAAQFLERQGLTLLERNFRTRRGEIDLVMREGEVIVFVEVRLRTNSRYGGAAASITARKQARLVAAALVYLARLGREPPCRFDAVLLDALAPDRIAWERHILER
jgi:putative endonuclease